LVLSILKLSIQSWIHLSPLDQPFHQANNENSTINILKEATVEHMFMDNAITWNKLNIKEIASECERNYFIIFVYIIKFFCLLPHPFYMRFSFFFLLWILLDYMPSEKFSIIGIRICIQIHAEKTKRWDEYEKKKWNYKKAKKKTAAAANFLQPLDLRMSSI